MSTGGHRDAGAASFAPREPQDAAPSATLAAAARHRRNASATPGAFLGGAIGRLLPPSIPFRYFGAAVVFNVLAWAALLVGAGGAAHFRGGLGWPLAALHLITLGVLVMTAIGASLQLLPVATRLSFHSRRAPAFVWWLYTPGVAATTLAMGIGSTPLLAAGAGAIAAALAVYAAVLARNLLGARGMPAVVAHVWVAWASLAVMLIAGLSLAWGYIGEPIVRRDVALALHVPLAAYGFIGMLALGLSYIIVPLFALSRAPSERPALASCALAAIALSLAAGAALGVAGTLLRLVAVAVGAAAVAFHLRAMNCALRTGMRKEQGDAFRLVRVAWVMLVASLAAGAGVAASVPFDRMETLFGFALVVGWLLTFLLGILQRIVPFLASMHAARGRHLPPTPSSLAAGHSLRVHCVSHLAAFFIVALSIVFDSVWGIRIGAAAGLASAIAFLVFFVTVVKRMAGARVAGSAHVLPA